MDDAQADEITAFLRKTFVDSRVHDAAMSARYDRRFLQPDAIPRIQAKANTEFDDWTHTFKEKP